MSTTVTPVIPNVDSTPFASAADPRLPNATPPMSPDGIVATQPAFPNLSSALLLGDSTAAFGTTGSGTAASGSPAWEVGGTAVSGALIGVGIDHASNALDTIATAPKQSMDLATVAASSGSYQVAQVVPPEVPEEDPLEREETEPGRGETSARRPMSDDELRNAELSSDPAVRSVAYRNAKDQLGKLDPTNPNAGPELTRQGWTPSGKDIERVRQDLRDAHSADAFGYTPEAYRKLASDPAQGGIADSKGREERDATIKAVRDGKIRGPLVRDPTGHADFRDVNGKDWDVKSFRSNYENGFNQKKSADSIDEELRVGENVVVNTANMSASDVEKLQSEGARRGWGSRVVYANSSPDFCPFPPSGRP